MEVPLIPLLQFTEYWGVPPEAWTDKEPSVVLLQLVPVFEVTENTIGGGWLMMTAAVVVQPPASDTTTV